MPSPLFDISPLLEPIAQNALILTPNNRLKNKLLQAYNQWQQDQGKQVWAAPRVHSLQQWLVETYQNLLDGLHLTQPRSLASEPVRRQLWLDIIAADSRGAELINPLKLASDAETALQSLWRWRVDPLRLDGSASDDTSGSEASAATFSLNGDEQQLFSLWAREFIQRLEQQQLHTAEQLQIAVTDYYLAKPQAREPLLITLGFDDLPPLTQQTFAAAAEHNEPLDSSSAQSEQTTVVRRGCQDFDGELQLAARWSRDLVARDPSASVAIIVPNLGQCRAQLERTFVEVFEPHYLLPEVARYTLPFNFSAGIPLGQTALIHDTLSLLRLNQHSLDSEGLIRLLHSPFWRASTAADDTNQACSTPPIQEETDFLCDLAAAIKRELKPQLKIARLRQLVHRLAQQRLQQHEQQHDRQQHERRPFSHDHTRSHQLDAFTHGSAPELTAEYFGGWLDQCLQDLEAMRRRQPKAQSAAAWADQFIQQLQQLGWPGQRRLDSNEYQQMQQWFSLLEDFTLLDQLAQPLTQAQALEQLSQLANSQHFQAQTPDSPIQILGILEGSGLAFSHCWVMGMNQRDWPPAPQPNPLLPLEMQRSLGMPHADAERELQYAERLTHGYKHCASEVIFSYAQHESGTPLQRSALIESIPEQAADTSPQTSAVYTDLASYLQSLTDQTQTALEWVNCAQAPEVSERERKHLRGGSSILRNQAICPFSAFAIHRLGASLPLEPSQGLSPIVRGEILHNSLESLWTQLGDQRTLLDTDTEALQRQIRQAVNSELLRYQQREPELLGAHYLELELARQSQLIERWLTLEKTRPAFSVVACEASLKQEFNGLPLTLRLDRLDRLESGELLVIDYKTGSPSIKKWGGERPEEPQLPLYALLLPKHQEGESVSALMFAEINAKAIAIKGLGQLSEPCEGISQCKDGAKLELPEDWPGTLEHWQRVLTQLSTDFLQGDCSLQFKSPALARYYTELSALMRSAEQSSLIHEFNQRPALGATEPNA